jgi:hypothetical protein
VPFPLPRERSLKYTNKFGSSSALSDGYARQRVGYGGRDIQVLDDNWNLAETITNEDLKHVV